MGRKVAKIIRERDFWISMSKWGFFGTGFFASLLFLKVIFE
jgi:hypothetical protein